jgi:Skp family chaperone for outer membrane proteins
VVEVPRLHDHPRSYHVVIPLTASRQPKNQPRTPNPERRIPNAYHHTPPKNGLYALAASRQNTPRIFEPELSRDKTARAQQRLTHARDAPAKLDTVTDDPLTARSADVRTLIHRQVSLLSLCAAVAALQVASVAANAQQGLNQASANASKFGIAVVDIPYIFKNYSRFSATAEAMKKEMETIDGNVKAERQNIAAAEQARNGFKPGTPEYKKADEELARMMAEFQLKTSKLQKDFMERQAKLYYQTYLEVVDAVNVYATSHNIGLVLRFNGEPVDANRREDVMRDINKQVVIQNQIDITPDVLMLLNRDQRSQPTQPSTATNRPIGSQLPPK